MLYNNRTPFILKKSDDPTLIENELYINDMTGLIYIYKENESSIGVSYMRIYAAIERALSKYMGSLTQTEINELVDSSNKLYKWMTDNESGTVKTPESNILNIFRVFNRFSPYDSLRMMINSMIDKEDGKTLVSNSFNLDHILKIDSIEKDANFYAHPDTLQCDLGNKVESVIINGETRTGNVVISKEDIGYGGVEYGANKYEHPRKQQCAAGVVSINGEKGYVELDKSSFNIRSLPNVPPATYSDYSSESNSTMFLSSTAVEYMNDKLASIISKHKTKLTPGYRVEFTAADNSQIRSVSIGGVTHTEFTNNKMIFSVYHKDVVVSVTDRRRENIVIQNLNNLRKGTTRRIRYTAGNSVEII